MDEDLKKQIRELRQENDALKDEVRGLRHIVSTLRTEKSSRVESSASLRGEVRKFVQENIASMQKFMFHGDLLDYIGSEQVPRAHADSGKHFLVDFSNQIRSGGVLTGMGGYFYKPGTVVVKVLRPAAGKYVVVWKKTPTGYKLYWDIMNSDLPLPS